MNNKKEVDIMSKKGISIVSLSITIIILLVLVSTISVSLTFSITNAKKMTFAKEIYNIQSLVDEYIEKENTLPITTDALQIIPSDMSQFSEEIVVDEKITLEVLDLQELDIKNTNFGTRENGDNETQKAKDVYAVSASTGRVYYIAGVKVSDKTYYTLTEELLNIMDKSQELVVGEETILFTPNKIGWQNEAISVVVTVPAEYEISDFQINNSNITYTTETSDDIIYYMVNDSKINENYTITVSYIKNGIEGIVSYMTRIDNTAPVIYKESTVENTADHVRGLSATDSESGIKHFKYVEGVINYYDTKDYMRAYGLDMNKGTINMKNKTAYTLYAEDKAGNYMVYYIDGSGERFYPKIKEMTGTYQLSLSDCYNLNMVNYRIYGNSVQDGTPTTDTPVEIQSVGDKTDNLAKFEETTLSFTTSDTTNYQRYISVLSDVPLGTVQYYVSIDYEMSSSDNDYYVLLGTSRTPNNGITYNIGGTKKISKENPSGTLTFKVTRGSEFTTVLNYFGFRVYIGSNSILKYSDWEGSITLKNIMISYESSAYESYGYRIPVKVNDVTTNIYLDEPLRKVGDYADYIDFEKQKVFRNVEVIDDTGALPIEESFSGVVDNTGTSAELPRILLNEGTNIIEVDTTIPPSQTSVWYYTK